MRLEVCLDEYLHRFLAGVHFDPKRRITEIDLVAATVLLERPACYSAYFLFVIGLRSARGKMRC